MLAETGRVQTWTKRQLKTIVLGKNISFFVVVVLFGGLLFVCLSLPKCLRDYHISGKIMLLSPHLSSKTPQYLQSPVQKEK